MPMILQVTIVVVMMIAMQKQVSMIENKIVLGLFIYCLSKPAELMRELERIKKGRELEQAKLVSVEMCVAG